MSRGPFIGLINPYRKIRLGGECIAVHRARAVAALGHPLPKGAQVHHADWSKDENAPLVICQDYRYHMLLHARGRVVRAGGNPNTQRICCRCKQLRNLSEFRKSLAGRDGRRNLQLQRECKKCENARRLARFHRQRG